MLNDKRYIFDVWYKPKLFPDKFLSSSPDSDKKPSDDEKAVSGESETDSIEKPSDVNDDTSHERKLIVLVLK